MSKRKPYNSRAGYVASRHNKVNNGWVVIYRAAEQGMDASDGKYAVVCEMHATICNVSSIPKARSFLKLPEFCEYCMNEYRTLHPEKLETIGAKQ